MAQAVIAKSCWRSLKPWAHYGITGVMDDDEAKRGNIVYGYPVLGTRDQLTQLSAEDVHYAIVAIGDNFNRAELA